MPDASSSRTPGAATPPGVDSTRANVARAYDYCLGGKDNYPADRAVIDAIREIAPAFPRLARRNRDWQQRVVRYLAGPVGVDQFVELGAGLPTPLGTHDIVRLENRGASVVYVDSDPLCVAHGRAMLDRGERTHFVAADPADPLATLGEVGRYLDVRRPIAVLLCGVLQHVPSAADPAALVRAYSGGLAAGSYVAISHFWDPADDSIEHKLAVEIQRRYIETGPGSGWFRTRAEIASYFGDLELLEPGLVELGQWWPTGPQPAARQPEEGLMLGGVARIAPDAVVYPLGRARPRSS